MINRRLEEIRQRAHDAQPARADMDYLLGRLERAESAIENCLRTSNGHEPEWGERAVASIGFLHEFAMTKHEDEP